MVLRQSSLPPRLPVRGVALATPRTGSRWSFQFPVRSFQFHMATFRQVEDIKAWQAARRLVVSVYALSRTAPFSGDCALCDQIRRAVVSVASNIAEGFERGTPRDFIHFLHMARGSAGEVRTQLHIALDLGYISQDAFQGVAEECRQIIQMITGLVAYLNTCEPKRISSEKRNAAEGDLP